MPRFEVSDMARSIEFYRDFLGMRLPKANQAGEVEAIPVELTFCGCRKIITTLFWPIIPNKKYRPRTADDDVLGPVFPTISRLPARIEQPGRNRSSMRKNWAWKSFVARVVHSPWDPRGDGSWGENESFYVLDTGRLPNRDFCNMGSIDKDGVFKNAQGERIEQARAVEV